MEPDTGSSPEQHRGDQGGPLENGRTTWPLRMPSLREIPNWLTLFRLALVPIFVFLMLDPSRFMVNVALGVFVIAALTDSIDGFIARRYGGVSDIGKLLDPLVDKILVMAALVMLTAQRSDLSGEPWVPGWMVVLVLAREIWVTGVRGIAAARGTVVPANSAGKVKSGLQMVAIGCLLLHDYMFPLTGFQVTCQLIGLNLLFVSIVFSYLGAYEYSRTVLGAAGAAAREAAER